METVLVTGGCGFIGGHVVDDLVKRGYEVKVIDKLEWQVHRRSPPKYINPKAHYFYGDMANRNLMENLLSQSDYVINLAGSVGAGQSFWESERYMQNNVVNTALMYDIILKKDEVRSKIKKIVVASSKSIYGEGAYKCETHGPFNPETRNRKQIENKEWEVRCPECGDEAFPIGVTEEKPPQVPNPYSLSKYAQEKLSLDYAYALGIPTVALRYFAVYGDRQSLINPYSGVIAIFLSRLKSGNPPILYEDGKMMRDFIYVGDAARITCDALTKGEGAYNVGTGRPSSIIELVNSIKREIGSDVEPKITGETRPGDNRHDFADMSSLFKDFGTYKFVDIPEGIHRLSNWSANEAYEDNFSQQEEERRRYVPM